MSFQLLRLPMLTQYEIFGLLSLQEKIIISTVSTRCQLLVKQVLTRQTFHFTIKNGQKHVLKSSNSDSFEFEDNKKSPLRDVHLYDLENERIPVFMGHDYVAIMRKMLETFQKVLRSCSITLHLYFRSAGNYIQNDIRCVITAIKQLNFPIQKFSVRECNETLLAYILNNCWDVKELRIFCDSEIKKFEPSRPFECDSAAFILCTDCMNMDKFLKYFSNCKSVRVYYSDTIEREEIIPDKGILDRLEAVPVKSIIYNGTLREYGNGDCYKFYQKDGTEVIVRREWEDGCLHLSTGVSKQNGFFVINELGSVMDRARRDFYPDRDI